MEDNRKIYNKVCGNADIDVKLISEKKCEINSTNQNEITTKTPLPRNNLNISMLLQYQPVDRDIRI
jgi:hypothetical protein